MSDVSRIVGARIRALRERRGLTQAELGVRVGLTRRSVRELEMGRRRPSLAKVHAFGVALESDPVYLASGVAFPGAEVALDAWDRLVRSRMRARRLEASLGLKALGRRARIHKTSLLRLETGETQDLFLDQLDAVAQGLSLALHELLNPRQDVQDDSGTDEDHDPGGAQLSA